MKNSKLEQSDDAESNPAGSKPLRFRGIVIRIFVGVGAVLTSAFFLIPVAASSESPANFDVQVVLGGNTKERGEISECLWLKYPTTIIVTGDAGYTIQ